MQAALKQKVRRPASLGMNRSTSQPSAYFALRKPEELLLTDGRRLSERVRADEPTAAAAEQQQTLANTDGIEDQSVLLVLEQVSPGSTQSVELLRKWLRAEPITTARVISNY
jgi:hypothetical protein